MKTISQVVIAAALLLALAPVGHTQNANVAVCAGCHGAHGEGSSTGVPRLAGQNTEYLSHALSMFKARTRASPIMQPIAQGLSDVDIQALSGYFSGQSAPIVDGKVAVSPALVTAGKQLVATGTVRCFECHGEGGRGNGARYPSIAGQPARFVVDRIHEFQQRAREKTPQPGTMTAVSTMLSEDQIRAYAAYLSQLKPGNPGGSETH
jgi:cytochrome c553